MTELDRPLPEEPDDAAPDPWDSALHHAFAVQAPAPSVVMQSICLRTGRAVHVALRDLGGECAPLRLQTRTVDWSGSTSGRYTVRGELARGGVGMILLAHDSDLGRDVAVKVLHEQLADDAGMLQRFVEEAQIGGQLQHPGIVPVYELGIDLRQRPYFTMKLVQGQTLAQMLAARSAPHDDHARLLDVFGRVCETVAYAHARGVVHRDLKPGNIMVGEFGEVLVMDWGFAKVLGRRGDAAPSSPPASIALEGAPVSIAGTVLGTPAYMPPEQAEGAIERLDARADVFALGAILCEILSGAPPYVGAELLQQARDGLLAPALARLATCGADPALVELAGQCLQRDLTARPDSAQVLRARLVEFAATASARADAARLAAAAAQARVVEERKRRRLLLVLVATALCLFAVAGAYLSNHRERVQNTAQVARSALARALERLAADDPPAARDALEEARTVVRAGTPDAPLLAEVEAASARIMPAQRAFAVEKKLLETMLRPGPELRPGSSEIVEALRTVGVDVRTSAAEIAAAVRAQEAAALPILCRALHDVASRPRASAKPLGAVVGEVLAALDQLDPNPWHRRVRQAWASDDPAALRALQAKFEAEDAPASAWELLAAAFLRCAPFHEASGPLAAAHALDPQSFWVNFRLAVLLRMVDPPRHADAQWHAELAMAAFPGRRFGVPQPPPGFAGGRRGRRGH